MLKCIMNECVLVLAWKGCVTVEQNRMQDVGSLGRFSVKAEGRKRQWDRPPSPLLPHQPLPSD